MDLVDLGVSAVRKQAPDLFQISAWNSDGLNSMDFIPE